MKVTTDRAVIETRKVLLATFIGGRDPEAVPQLDDNPHAVFAGRKDAVQGLFGASAPNPDMAEWISALGGETPQEVSQGFVEQKFLELRAQVLTLMPPGYESSKTIGHLTPKGASVANAFLNAIQRSDWEVESRLGESKVKSALKWTAGFAVGGIIGSRSDALLMEELRRLFGDGAHTSAKPVGIPLQFEQPGAPKQHDEIPVAPAVESDPGLLQAGVVEPGAATALSFSLLAAKLIGWFRRRR
jgi:hypothetical protein